MNDVNPSSADELVADIADARRMLDTGGQVARSTVRGLLSGLVSMSNTAKKQMARAEALQDRIDAALEILTREGVWLQREHEARKALAGAGPAPEPKPRFSPAALTEPNPAPEHDSECDYGKTFFGYLNTDCTCATPAPEPPKLDPLPWRGRPGVSLTRRYVNDMGWTLFDPRSGYSQCREDYS